MGSGRHEWVHDGRTTTFSWVEHGEHDGREPARVYALALDGAGRILLVGDGRPDEEWWFPGQARDHPPPARGAQEIPRPSLVVGRPGCGAAPRAGHRPKQPGQLTHDERPAQGCRCAAPAPTQPYNGGDDRRPPCRRRQSVACRSRLTASSPPHRRGRGPPTADTRDLRPRPEDHRLSIGSTPDPNAGSGRQGRQSRTSDVRTGGDHG